MNPRLVCCPSRPTWQQQGAVRGDQAQQQQAPWRTRKKTQKLSNRPKALHQLSPTGCNFSLTWWLTIHCLLPPWMCCWCRWKIIIWSLQAGQTEEADQWINGAETKQQILIGDIYILLVQKTIYLDCTFPSILHSFIVKRYLQWIFTLQCRFFTRQIFIHILMWTCHQIVILCHSSKDKFLHRYFLCIRGLVLSARFLQFWWRWLFKTSQMSDSGFSFNVDFSIK